MTVAASLRRLSIQQGWNESSQLDLCLRYIEALDGVTLDGVTLDGDHFDTWLANKAAWENLSIRVMDDEE